MRLFVSYARVDKPYCIQIVNTLDVHDVWYDQRLYAGQEWWKEILRRLDWCEGFIYLLSPDSIASEYCQKEYELAKELGRKIFPVLIHENTQLPVDLTDVQYVDLCNGLTPDSVKLLLNSIYIAERQQETPRGRETVENIDPKDIRPPVAHPARVIREAIMAMENDQFDRAVLLLKQAKSNGFKSRFINIDTILAEAELGLARQIYLREAEREYKQIAELVKFDRTLELGLEAFRRFQEEYPDYDPMELIKLVARNGTPMPVNGAAPVAQTAKSDAPPPLLSPKPARPDFQIPSLEWCAIPQGLVKVVRAGANGASQIQSLYLDDFKISKYPVTNAQYQIFIDDPDGYSNVEWWKFSTHAYNLRMGNSKPRDSRFKGKERPREMVSWYDAIAFCNWLTEQIGMKVTLPTQAQWQRAAQGDDFRTYPWGDPFDKALANTRESNLKMTTLVMRYAEGASPYGVFDMAGNVWEWCLNSIGEYDRADITTDKKRAVKGGSYVSYFERSEITFQYYLKPETLYGSIGFRLVTS